MEKERSFTWDVAIPLAIIACGIVVTFCNAFPYVHNIPGGLSHPGGYPDYPPTDQASAGDSQGSMWQSFLTGGSPLGVIFVILGILPIIFGSLKLLARHSTVANILINTLLLFAALIGLLFTWLTGVIFLNDAGDLATYLPAALWAGLAYLMIVVIIVCLTLRTLFWGYIEGVGVFATKSTRAKQHQQD